MWITLGVNSASRSDPGIYIHAWGTLEGDVRDGPVTSRQPRNTCQARDYLGYMPKIGT